MKLLSRIGIALAICLMAIPIMATPVEANPGFSLRNTTSYTGLDREEGYVGDEVTIRGDDEDSPVWIYYELYNEDEDDWPYWKVSGDYDEIEEVYDYDKDITIPESCKGEHEIRVCYDDDPDKEIETLTFTVYPLIEIDEEEGAAGTEVEATGYGWDEDESEVEIRFYLEDPDDDYDDKDLYEVAWSEDIEVDDYGTWEDVTFEVPAASKGDHWIYAVGDESDDIEDDEILGVEFEVLPGISLDKESGGFGETITVTGSGFEDDEKDIEILFDGDVVKDNIEADDDGIWEGTFEVPEAAKGTYDVTAEGRKTDKEDIDEVEFEVLPGLVLSPTQGHVGTSLTISGGGFLANKSVTITYDGVTKGSATTNSKGSFSGISFEATHTQTTHTVEHTVVATYDTTTLSTKFIMESLAPAKPTLSSPVNASRVGLFRKQTPTFEWSAVTDDSGVSYNLQIGTSAAFAQVLISKTGLTEVSYTLTGAEALSYGTYYWRVKAVDGAQNDSVWTTAYSFKSALLPLWAFIVIVALIVVLIGALVFVFGIRRRGGYD